MVKLEKDAAKTASLRKRLLGWYERNRRDLPWRRAKNPYAIWVSEIMLQQTRAAVVAERYPAFMERFPDAGGPGAGAGGGGAGALERAGVLPRGRGCCTRRRSL